LFIGSLVPTSKDLVFRKTLPERLSLIQNSEPAKKSSDYSLASCIGSWQLIDLAAAGLITALGVRLSFLPACAGLPESGKATSVLI
jgi:hypothetical protein